MKKEVRKQDISFLQIETYFIDGTVVSSIFEGINFHGLNENHTFKNTQICGQWTISLQGVIRKYTSIHLLFHGSTQQNSTKSMKII